MKHLKMEWPAMPHGSIGQRELHRKFAVRAIPHLVIIDRSGKIVTRNAYQDVHDNAGSAFDKWWHKAKKRGRFPMNHECPVFFGVQ